MFDQVRIVIFAPSLSSLAGEIAQALVPALPEGSCDIFAATHLLRAHLQLLGRETCVVILVAADQRELNGMFDMMPLLEGQPLILMVPDSDSFTAAKAHRLRPRYLMFPETGLPDLLVATKEILKKYSYG